jgi:hypothetical protein
MSCKTPYRCESCNCEIDGPGLCNICLKRHDRVVKLIVLIIWVLAFISFGYYYVFFIR